MKNEKPINRPLKAALIISNDRPIFTDILEQTLLSRGYTDIIHRSPQEALEMARKSAVHFAAICMDGACETQSVVRKILVAGGNTNFAFIPPNHNACPKVFDRFLSALS